MATLALGAIGAAAAPSLFGAASISALGFTASAASIGYAVGSTLGSYVDSMLFAPSAGNTEGVRLSDLRVSSASEGTPIKRVYGRMRVSGQYIWADDIEEVKKTQSVGKGGGGSVTNYEYFLSFAVAVCEGQIIGVNKIFMDGKLFWENGKSKNDEYVQAIYKGDSLQSPNSVIEAVEGAGETPAFRNTAYVVFERMPLSTYGNRPPNIEFEVMTEGTTTDHKVSDSVAHSLTTIESTSQPVYRGRSKAWDFGVSLSGSSAAIQARAYDISGDAPVIEKSVTSANFSADSINALTYWPSFSKEKILVAVNVTLNGADYQYCAIYDTITNSIGTPQAIAAPGSYEALDAVVGIGDDKWFIRTQGASNANGVLLLTVNGTEITEGGHADSGTAALINLEERFSFTRIAEDYAFAWWKDGNDLKGRAVFHRNGSVFFDGDVQTLPNMATNYTSGSGDPYAFYWFSTGANEHTLFANTGSATVELATVSIDTSLNYSVTRSRQTFSVSDDSNSAIFANDKVEIIGMDGSGGVERTPISLGSGSFSAGSAVSFEGSYSDFYIVASGIDTQNIILVGDVNIHLVKPSIEPQDITVGEIVDDLLSQAGYQASEYDSSAATKELAGYVVDNVMPARNAIAPLGLFQNMDIIEQDSQLVATRRTDITGVSIDSDLIGFGEREDIVYSTVQAEDLPKEIIVNYYQANNNYDKGSQRASRFVTSASAVRVMDLPMAISGGEAKRISQRALYLAWVQRNNISLNLPRDNFNLSVSDGINIDGNTWRITSTQSFGQSLEVEAHLADVDTYTQEADADITQSYIQTVPSVPAGYLLALELPPLSSSDAKYGHYLAVASSDDWESGIVTRSVDNVVYDDYATLLGVDTVGATVGALSGSNASAYIIDKENTVQVSLASGTLSSITENEFMSGVNIALIGREIIYFRDATFISGNTYEVSYLLRGQHNTESYINQHSAGESFIMLNALDFVEYSSQDVGKSFYYKMIDDADSADDPHTIIREAQAISMKPFSPIHAKATRSIGDIALSWIRQARINYDWLGWGNVSGGEVPLDYAQESYEVDILDGSDVVRTIETATASCDYTSAEQVLDFGTTQSAVDVLIYQINDSGTRGNPLEATL